MAASGEKPSKKNCGIWNNTTRGSISSCKNFKKKIYKVMIMIYSITILSSKRVAIGSKWVFKVKYHPEGSVDIRHVIQ